MSALNFTHTLLLALTLLTDVSTAWTLPSAAAALHKHIFEQLQHPIMEPYPPNSVLPTSSSPTEDIDPKSGHRTGPIIADVLPKIKGINIFASLTRDFEEVATRLNDSSRNVTVLAPRNSAIQGLPRKPWENPKDYEEFGEVAAYKGSEGEDRARKNLRKFVDAHLIPSNPWRKGEEVATLGGGKIRWSKDEEKIYIQPGGVEVDHIAAEVSNGEVWVLNGVLNYQ